MATSPGDARASRAGGGVSCQDERHAYRWKILGLTFGAQAATAALFQGLPAIAPTIAEAYGLSLTEVGAALGALVLGMTITLLPWGLAADRFGERLVIPSGLAGTAVVLAFLSASRGSVALFAGLLVAGLWAASANAAGGRAVMGWFAASERGLAMGLRGASIPVGGATAAIALPLLAEGFGPRAAFVALAGAIAVATLASAAWLRDPPPRAAQPGPELRRRAALRDGALWRIAGVTMLLAAGQFALIGFLALFLTDARGLPAPQAGLALLGVQVTSAVARVAAGRWSDRTGSRGRPLRALALVAACGFVALGALAHAPAPLLLAALVVATLGGVSWNTLTMSASAELAAPGAAGAAIGMQNTALALGGALLLPLFALLVEATSWGIGFAAVSLCPFAAWLLLGRFDVDERRAY